MPAKNHADFNQETRIALLEKTTDHIYETLLRMEKRFDKIDGRFDKMEAKIDSHFYMLLTLYLGGFAGIFAIMAKGFHWY